MGLRSYSHVHQINHLLGTFVLIPFLCSFLSSGYILHTSSLNNKVHWPRIFWTISWDSWSLLIRRVSIGSVPHSLDRISMWLKTGVTNSWRGPLCSYEVVKTEEGGPLTLFGPKVPVSLRSVRSILRNVGTTHPHCVTPVSCLGWTSLRNVSRQSKDCGPQSIKRRLGFQVHKSEEKYPLYGLSISRPISKNLTFRVSGSRRSCSDHTGSSSSTTFILTPWSFPPSEVKGEALSLSRRDKIDKDTTLGYVLK